jgi:hypothetical protein
MLRDIQLLPMSRDRTRRFATCPSRHFGSRRTSAHVAAVRKDNRGGLRIFDFDDCGYGLPAFDVANALYMVLFDAVVHAAPESDTTFRESFVSGYTDTARHPFNADVLDDVID